MDPQLNCLVPFIGPFGLADVTPDRRQTHYPHSSKTSHRFAQSGFNEVADSACVIQALSPATSQNPPDSQDVLNVIQAGICDGDQLGTRPDV